MRPRQSGGFLPCYAAPPCNLGDAVEHLELHLCRAAPQARELHRRLLAAQMAMRPASGIPAPSESCPGPPSTGARRGRPVDLPPPRTLRGNPHRRRYRQNAARRRRSANRARKARRGLRGDPDRGELPVEHGAQPLGPHDHVAEPEISVNQRGRGRRRSVLGEPSQARLEARVRSPHAVELGTGALEDGNRWRLRGARARQEMERARVERVDARERSPHLARQMPAGRLELRSLDDPPADRLAIDALEDEERALEHSCRFGGPERARHGHPPRGRVPDDVHLLDTTERRLVNPPAQIPPQDARQGSGPWARLDRDVDRDRCAGGPPASGRRLSTRTDSPVSARR
jgi:hypothetical protein